MFGVAMEGDSKQSNCCSICWNANSKRGNHQLSDDNQEVTRTDEKHFKLGVDSTSLFQRRVKYSIDDDGRFTR